MSKPSITEKDLADLFDAFNRHDVEAIMAYFADDCVFDAVAGPEVYGARFIGAEAISQAFSGVWAAMPDARWEHHGHLVHGDRAVCEWTFTGTNKDGTRVEAQGADLFRLRDGRIVHKQAFRKNRPLLRG
ncbi:nuclear transport factor 2 family protein [Microvirga sp. Marseille-Q2068]|uniref:Nuclear transport factor 2 family protein n=1 Tax=Microvirga mediterraneensis TaxID=2754695 RepID=A0A838BP62_9HYPH|nr:nuclear transport factor 2 family protein [Microvirga mediterraneensis]MBA1156849.1 nuclear transport factor 2 family protein [Microvirga mediterraneensis]